MFRIVALILVMFYASAAYAGSPASASLCKVEYEGNGVYHLSFPKPCNLGATLSAFAGGHHVIGTLPWVLQGISVEYYIFTQEKPPRK